MIEIKNVTFKHKNIDAIKDISLDIEKGEFIAIIGINGSGKSTLAKLISGIILPKNGDIYIDGINTKDKKSWFDIRKKTGIVFQNPENQLVFANIEDDIKFMLENFNFNSDEIERRIEDSLKKVNMQDYRNKEIYELSMGQKQRIAIAEMLALEPEYLILDEPTAMLDPATKPEFLNIIKDIRTKQNITVIYVTNIVEEILSADRIIALDDGKISFECTKENIIDNIENFKNIGLIIPKMVELINELNKNGYTIDKGKFEIKDIIEGIKRK